MTMSQLSLSSKLAAVADELQGASVRAEPKAGGNAASPQSIMDAGHVGQGNSELVAVGKWNLSDWHSHELQLLGCLPTWNKTLSSRSGTMSTTFTSPRLRVTLVTSSIGWTSHSTRCSEML